MSGPSQSDVVQQMDKYSNEDVLDVNAQDFIRRYLKEQNMSTANSLLPQYVNAYEQVKNGKALDRQNKKTSEFKTNYEHQILTAKDTPGRAGNIFK